MPENFESQIDEEQLREIMGHHFSPSLLAKLQKVEAELVPKRVELSEQAERRKISNAFFALELNRLNEELLLRVAEIIGEEYCRDYFGFGPGDGFTLLDVRLGAEEDSKILQRLSPYQDLYPKAVEELRAANQFVDRLKLSAKRSAFFLSLPDLLKGIEESARLAIASNITDCQAWFVLNETNDINEPYFPFICSLVKMGLRLRYASDKPRVITQIERLKEKLCETLEPEAGNSVDHILLGREPRLENLCFLSVGGSSLIEAFAAFRAQGTTIGGYLLPDDEADEQWSDLQSTIIQVQASKRSVHSI